MQEGEGTGIGRRPPLSFLRRLSDGGKHGINLVGFPRCGVIPQKEHTKEKGYGAFDPGLPP